MGSFSSSSGVLPKIDAGVSLSAMKTSKVAPLPTSPAPNCTNVAKEANPIKSQIPQEAGKSDSKGTLPKEPGWRLSSSSKMKVTEPRSSCEDELDRVISSFKSDTSISSNGPLKEYYRADRSRIKHQPKLRFDPPPKLVKEAVLVSATLEKLAIQERPDLMADQMLKKGPAGQDAKQACPLDPNGGYLGNSLEHVKLVTYYDTDDLEKSSRSGKSNQVPKSSSSKRGKQQAKVAEAKDSPKKND